MNPNIPTIALILILTVCLVLAVGHLIPAKRSNRCLKNENNNLTLENGRLRAAEASLQGAQATIANLQERLEPWIKNGREVTANVMFVATRFYQELHDIQGQRDRTISQFSIEDIVPHTDAAVDHKLIGTSGQHLTYQDGPIAIACNSQDGKLTLVAFHGREDVEKTTMEVDLYCQDKMLRLECYEQFFFAVAMKAQQILDLEQQAGKEVVAESDQD